MEQTKTRSFFLRNLEGERLADYFLLSAVTSILIIRFYLHVTGYPIIGVGRFHIAHVLWGGFLMLIALMISLLYLSRSSRTAAAVIGGVGFGAFVDELGKFITRDNDYLYQPTIAIIYVIFVVLYLILESTQKRIKATQEEYIVNSLELMKDAIEGDLSIEEKEQAILLLKKSGVEDDFTHSFISLLQRTPTAFSDSRTLSYKIKHTLQSAYNYLLKTKWFIQLLLWFFILKSLFSLISNSFILYASVQDPTLSFTQWGALLSGLLASFLVAVGVIKIRSRIKAYRLFKYSVLISLLFTQFFAFYIDQLSAISGFLFNLVLYGILNYMIRQEITLKKKDPLEAVD